jgi:hypothetical protein
MFRNMLRNLVRNMLDNMVSDDSFQESSQAYQAGYQDGYCGKQSSPEKFPGQEEEYCKGPRKGWLKGYPGQYRTTN